jgi:undecaprenyl diphosphate synthase
MPRAISGRIEVPAPEPKKDPLSDIPEAKRPRSLAIIMDGNGRWAEERGRRRMVGHRVGADSVRAITRECARLGFEELTLYAFSAENWSRPRMEVAFLMKLLKRFLIGERDEIMNNSIRFRAIGQLERLPKDVFAEYERTRDMSADNDGMILRLALSYGSRQEIFEAAKRMAELRSEDPEAYAALESDDFRRFLHDPEMRDPDLMIRTSFERRLSNFLLWQLSYAEFYVTKIHWPEFREAQLHEAVRDYAARERRFGGLV